MEVGGSLPYLQKLTIWRYHQPVYLRFIPYLRLRLPIDVFFWCLPNTVLHVYLVSTMHAYLFPHLMFLELITIIILGKGSII